MYSEVVNLNLLSCPWVVHEIAPSGQASGSTPEASCQHSRSSSSRGSSGSKGKAFSTNHNIKGKALLASPSSKGPPYGKIRQPVSVRIDSSSTYGSDRDEEDEDEDGEREVMHKGDNEEEED